MTLNIGSSGNVKTISGHFKKSELIAEHGLNVAKPTSSLTHFLKPHFTGPRPSENRFQSAQPRPHHPCPQRSHSGKLHFLIRFSWNPLFCFYFKVNILHIRALVKADAVVLFDTYGSADSRLHSVFLYHLEVIRIPLRFSLTEHTFSTT